MNDSIERIAVKAILLFAVLVTGTIAILRTVQGLGATNGLLNMLLLVGVAVQIIFVSVIVYVWRKYL